VGIEDALLASLVIKINELYTKRKTILFTVQENSPQLDQINAEIENNRNILLENITNLIGSNELSVKDLESRLVNIEKEVKKTGLIPNDNCNIQRNFNLNDQIYTLSA